MRGGKGAADLPLTYEGDWVATRPYMPRHLVKHADAAYLALARNTAVEPGTDSTIWFPLGSTAGGPVLYVSAAADGPPTDGSVFWYVTDQTC